MCRVRFLSGFFDMRPYFMVVMVGGIITVHTLSIAVYYLLPVNEEGEKYIPGKY